MTSLIVLGLALWMVPAPFFAMKSYRWNRKTKDRPQLAAVGLAVMAGLF